MGGDNLENAKKADTLAKLLKEGILPITLGKCDF